MGLLASRTKAASSGVVAGSFHADPDNLSGSNGGNGILVGETGRSGGSASGVSGTGPFNLAGWMTKLNAATLQPGDIMYHWTGNYAYQGASALASRIPVRSNTSTELALTTTSGPDPNRAWLVAYPGHAPRFDYRGATFSDRAIYSANGGIGPVDHVSGGNIRWEGWRVFCNCVIWGTTSPASRPSLDWFDIRVDHTGLTETFGDNVGVIMLENCPGSRVRGYQVVPNGQQTGNNANEGEIYWINNVAGTIIEHSLFRRDGTGFCMHHKRQGTDLTVRFCFVYKAGAFVAPYKGEAQQDHYFEDSIFVSGDSGTGGRIFELYQDSSTNNPNAYRNTIERCLLTTMGSNTPDAGVCAGGTNPANQGVDTILRRNIYHGKQQIGYAFNESSPTYTHSADSDENQFLGSGNIAREFGTNYSSLASWQANTTYFGGAHDGSSIAVTPTFGTRDVWDPSTFEPTNPQTIGGTAVGPDFSLVGPVGAGYTLGA